MAPIRKSAPTAKLAAALKRLKLDSASRALLKPYLQAVRRHPNNARAWYDLAVLLLYAEQVHLARHPELSRKAELGPDPVGARGAVLAAFEQTLRLKPNHARACFHAGRLLGDLERHKEAVALLRRAVELDPKNLAAWTHLMTSAGALEEKQKQYAAEASRAEREARRLLPKKAHGYGWAIEIFRQPSEKLLDEAHRIRRRVEGQRYTDSLRSDRQLAQDDRAAIRINPARVPRPLRNLIPLAHKWGIGDDSSRAWFVDRASQRDKQALATALAGRVQEISGWLDSFPIGKMSPEAGHFMYLLEACEEMGALAPKKRKGGK